MTFEEFKPLAAAMKSVYVAQSFLQSSEAVKVYYQMLRDIDYPSCSAAIMRHLQSSKYPPTIADIREACAPVDTGDWLSSWDRLCRAIHRWGWCRPDEGLAALRREDELAADIAKRLGWQALCMSENIVADRASFRQAYETASRRNRELMQLSPQLRLQLEGKDTALLE